MNVEIIKKDKNEFDLSVDSLTVAEILRVYLNESGIEFAAWRREHPSKPILMKVKSKSGTVPKAINEAVGAIKKDCDKILAALKKK